MDHSCKLTAFPSSLSVFGYGAHKILRAHPREKVIEPMPNFYESSANARLGYITAVIVAVKAARPEAKAYPPNVGFGSQTARKHNRRCPLCPKADIT
jgi:hypothetical protein